MVTAFNFLFTTDFVEVLFELSCQTERTVLEEETEDIALLARRYTNL